MGYLATLAQEALAYFQVKLAARSHAFAAPKVGCNHSLYHASAVQHVLPPGEEEPWFEANNLPLRWQVPIGVLYDLLTDGEDRPWSLTVSNPCIGPL